MMNLDTLNEIVNHPTTQQATAMLGALAVGTAHAAVSIWQRSDRRKTFLEAEKRNQQQSYAKQVQSEIRARASY